MMFSFFLFSLSPVNPTDAGGCNSSAVVVRLERPEGHVTWSDDTDHCPERAWIIEDNVPEDVGLILEVNDVQLAPDDTIKIMDTVNHSVGRPAVWTRVNLGNTVLRVVNRSPILLSSNQAVILMHTERRVSPKTRYSAFNFSLSTFPLHAMPHRLSLYDFVNDALESLFIYNCSSSVPAALLCDKVKQCTGGQDELHCDYLQPGCGDWVPYKDRCLKFLFHFVPFQTLGRSYPDDPIRAEKHCVEAYQAKLAHLPSEDDRQFVGEILARTGFSNVVVGLTKMRPMSAKTKRIYRFLWQWGGAGGPVAYDQVGIQTEGIGKSCSLLSMNESSVATIQPVDCRYNHKPDGYVCSKQNPLLQAERSGRQTSVALKTPSVAIEQFPTKPCSDGSLVQTFHSCTEQIGGRFLSPSQKRHVAASLHNISLALPWSAHPLRPPAFFDCTYGPSVHYSLVCSGFPDCADGSDELECEKPRPSSPLLRTSFVCRNAQIIPEELRCNGLFDCFDESDEESCFACVGSDASIQICPGLGCIPNVRAMQDATQTNQ